MGCNTFAFLKDIKEECLTEEGKRILREEKQYALEHPFWDEYGKIIGFFILIVVSCIFAFIIISIFGGK